MRAQERHHLKQNEFVATLTRVVTFAQEHRDRLVLAGVLVLALAAAAGGYFWLRSNTAQHAGEAFGIAMSVYESPIEPAPMVPGAAQAPGTYPTAAARLQAALAAFNRVALMFPSTPAGIGARYQTGEILLALGRATEAQAAYQDVIDHGGSSLYVPVARMGLAEAYLVGEDYPKAIKLFEDLAAQRDGALPVDGVLMQLAEAYSKAGKTAEARTTLKRVVDEFPQSPYVAGARQRLAAM